MYRRGFVLRLAVVGTALILLPFACRGVDFEGKPLAVVRFEPPLQPISQEELLRRSTLRPGTRLTSGDIRRAIQSLYATGHYEDIAVDAAETNGEITLTFETVNRWFVGRQEIEGAPEPPGESRLFTATKLTLGSEYAESNLQQATENLLSLLRANGLYQATVTTDVSRDAELESATIRFVIDSGPRARFDAPVVVGQTRLTPAEVIRATGWRQWFGRGPYRPVTESRVESGVRRIRSALEKQGFLMSRVDLSGIEYQAARNRAVPQIEIFDGPSVRLAVRGARISSGRLRTLVPIYQEQSVDRELLTSGARNIEGYLQSKGYFQADVRFETAMQGPDQQVEFLINRGRRFRFSGLEIRGNRYFDLATIRERMAVTPVSSLRFRQGRFSASLLDGDRRRILDLYRANGFLSAEVDTRVDTDGDRVAAEVQITEGPQFLIRELSIEGVDEATAAYVRSLLQSAEGQPFSELTLGIDREAVLNAFFNNGYVAAAMTWRIRREPEGSVNLTAVISPGPQQFVRRVVVTGLNRTDRKIVYNRIALRPGDPISLGSLFESQRRLYDLGIFARVDTSLQNPGGLEDTKLVLIDLEEARRYSFNVGVGAQIGRIGGATITNFDSPGGSTGFSPRLNFGVTRNNLFGVGHSLNFQSRLSNLQQRAQLTYLAPHFRDRDDLSLSLSTLFDNSRDVRTFAAERIEAAIQLSWRATRSNTFQGRYAVRQVSVDPDSLQILPALIPLLAQPVRLGLIGGTFIRDRRDNAIDATRGSYSSIDAAIALGAFGSQSNFARLIARNSTFHPVSREVVLARSVTFGLQDRLSGGPLNDIPLPERFFAGGASSHRGFPENQAGPRDPVTGFPIGGKALLVFNHELRYPLLGDSLRAVLFHDMGNVYSRVGRVSFRYSQNGLDDFDYMVQTVGLGFRYKTPIGPIRVDLGFSPNSPRFIGFEGTREELLFGLGRLNRQRINQFQFHFSLGQAF